jgi:hypothetical protein
VLVLVPNFTLSQKGNVIKEGDNIVLSVANGYFLDLDASSSTPQSAGLRYSWALVENSGGELSISQTNGRTIGWIVGCLLAANSSFTLAIQLTVSANGASANSVIKRWPVVVNQCGN